MYASLDSGLWRKRYPNLSQHSGINGSESLQSKRTAFNFQSCRLRKGLLQFIPSIALPYELPWNRALPPHEPHLDSKTNYQKFHSLQLKAVIVKLASELRKMDYQLDLYQRKWYENQTESNLSIEILIKYCLENNFSNLLKVIDS